MSPDLSQALSSVRRITDIRADIAIVLGSGLGDYAENIDGVSIPYADIEGFPLSTAPNHKGVLHIGTLHGRNVVAMQGRLHLYEGHSPQESVFPIEMAHALGSQSVILTNISGSLSADFETGDVIGISDHIYFPGLTGQGALVGRRSEARSPFVNLTHTYDGDWLDQMDLSKTGIYACLAGPHFETPAEGRMLQNMGADMVGMSTVHEAVMARYLEMRVLGLSLIVNPVITEPDTQIELTEADIWKGVKSAFPEVAHHIDDALRTCPY